MEEVVTGEQSDFGEGTLELEQQLLQSLDKAEGAQLEVEDKPSEEPVVEEPQEAEIAPEEKVEAPKEDVATPSEPVQIFDSEGNLSLKAGVQLSDEHIKELERGFLRQADYTRKTQEIAKIRDTANEILSAKEAIDADPTQLRQFFDDKQILSAFNELELLNIGLSAAKVPVEAWNTFKEWYREAGFNQNLPTAQPHIQELSQLRKEISGVGKTVQELKAERERLQQAELERTQKEAAEKAFKAIDDEVNSELAKYQKSEFPIEKEDLLVEMVKSNGTKSVADLAKGLHDRYAQRFSKYIQNKQTIKQKTVKPIKGQPVKIETKRPTNWEDAEGMVDRLFG